MRLYLLLVLLVSLATVVLAWDKDDYEIFDLVSDLEAAEGKGTTFYSHLGLDLSATTGEINKAYRKKSLELHPDKNPGVKDIQARFARLGVISQILRSPEKRERYNFFYKNGVPKWRGTGYYYSRFRPSLSHTLLFLVFLTSLFHLLVMRLNYNKDSKRVEYFSRSALNAAKNKQGKVERVNLSEEKENAGRRVKLPMVEGNEMAGYLELVVVGEHVYLPHDEDGSLTPLSMLATPPSYFRTWPFKLILLLTRKATAFLPPNLHPLLPEVIRPIDPSQFETEEAVELESQGYAVTPTGTGNGKSSRKNRQQRQDRSGTGTPRGNNTPKDSPVNTDLDGDGEGEGESDEGVSDFIEVGADGEEKKVPRKKGPGKAGGMRRRKMALKK